MKTVPAPVALAAGQQAFLTGLYGGPAALDPTLFDGGADRVHRALRLHANTVNHARIVAVEQTFPLTREAIGGEAFHRFAQAHVERDNVRRAPLATIGAGFARGLEQADVDPLCVTLALIEWAWLESHRAADASALALADLAALDPAAVLAKPVNLHPATRLVACPQGVPGEAVEAVSDDDVAVLIVRPEAEVRLIAIDAVAAALVAQTMDGANVAELFDTAARVAPQRDAGALFARLLGYGAFI